MKILVIEDSERLQRSLQHGLGRSGFAVDVVSDGDTGLAWAKLGHYDAIILDLMLPRLDGISLLRRLRAYGSTAHVLILSAKDEVTERVAGLQAGADDYLTKPFDFDELVARLRALIRRKYGTKAPTQQLGELELDTTRRSLSFRGNEIALTRSEYSLVEYLAARRGRVISKSELLDHLCAGTEPSSANAVEVLVHQLRRKVREAGHANVIRTMRGHGYAIE